MALAKEHKTSTLRSSMTTKEIVWANSFEYQPEVEPSPLRVGDKMGGEVVCIAHAAHADQP